MCSRTQTDDGWKAKYGNDSRPWLISGKMEDTPHLPTTMRDSFLPLENLKKPIGPRREILEKFLINEVSEKLQNEMKKEPEEEERITEYNGMFYKDGFNPNIILERNEQDFENYKKYPLYYDAGRTVWIDRLDTLHGKTQPADTKPMAIFRKNASFTKPITQVLDIPKPGSIGYK